MRPARLRRLIEAWSTGRTVALAASDQIAYAASNSLLAVSVARTASTSEFGEFALAYLILVGVMGIAKQGFGTSAMLATVSSGQADTDEHRSLTFQNALWVSVLLGIVSSLAGVVGMSVGSTSIWAVVLAVAGPALVADQLRNSAAGMGRQGESVVGSLFWVSAVVAAIFFRASPAIALLAWGAGATISAIWLSWRLRLRPRAFRISDLEQDDRISLGSLVAEAAANMAYRQLLFWFLALYVGLAAVGTLRAAQTLFSPAAVTVAGMLSGIAPRMREAGHATPRRRTLRLGASLTVFLVALSVAALLLLSPRVGETLVGETWQSASRVAPMVFIVRVAESVILGSQLELIASGRARSLAVTRAASSVSSVLIAVVGAASGGVMGAAVGMAISTVLFVPIWSRAAKREVSSAPLKARNDDAAL